MAQEEINFTKREIEALKPSADGKRRYVYDSKEPGLILQITGTGRKTFQLYKKHQGKPVRVTIGTFPDLSIELARKRAREIKVSLSNGENPTDTLRLQRQEMTFQDLFEIYLERHAKLRKRTWKEDAAYFKRHLTTLGRKQLSKITKGDIAAIHSKIGKEHPTHANRVLALISSIFGRGIEYGIYEEHNPCLGIRRFKEKSRDRFLSGEELGRLFKALADEPNITMRDFFIVALLTGARRSNVLSMKWQDIDMKNRVWHIPSTDSKNGEPLSLPLSEPVIEILHNRSNDSPFVFPGPGRNGHLMEPKNAWIRICKAAEIEGARIHDLRRTMGSWQAKTGASLPVIGRSLGHKSQQTTAIYFRLDLDPVRTSVERATVAMLEAASQEGNLAEHCSNE